MKRLYPFFVFLVLLLLLGMPFAAQAQGPTAAPTPDELLQLQSGVEVGSVTGPIVNTVRVSQHELDVMRAIEAAPKASYTVTDPLIPGAGGTFEKVDVQLPASALTAQEASAQDVSAQTTVLQSLFHNPEFEAGWYNQGTNRLPTGWTQLSSSCLQLGSNNLEGTGWDSSSSFHLGKNCDDVTSFTVIIPKHDDVAGDGLVTTNALSDNGNVVIDFHTKRASGEGNSMDFFFQPLDGPNAKLIGRISPSFIGNNWTGATFQTSFNRKELLDADGEFSLIFATQGEYWVDAFTLYLPFGMGVYQFNARLDGVGSHVGFNMTMQMNKGGETFSCTSPSGICNFTVYKSTIMGGDFNSSAGCDGKWGYGLTESTASGTFLNLTIPIMAQCPSVQNVVADSSNTTTMPLLTDITVLTTTTAFTNYLPIVVQSIPVDPCAGRVKLNGWCPSQQELINKLSGPLTIGAHVGALSTSSISTAVAKQEASTQDIGSFIGYYTTINANTSLWDFVGSPIYHNTGLVFAQLGGNPVTQVGNAAWGQMTHYMHHYFWDGSETDYVTYNLNGAAGWMYFKTNEAAYHQRLDGIDVNGIKGRFNAAGVYVSPTYLGVMELEDGSDASMIYVTSIDEYGTYLIYNLGPTRNYRGGIFFVGTGRQPFIRPN